MEQIKEDLELCEFDGIDSATVYCGGLSYLEKAELKWRNADEETCETLGMCEVHILKLSEIAKQLNSGIITIIIEEPLKGRILQYGNYGDSWWEIGTTCGYA